jgi:dihydrofolate reductase
MISAILAVDDRGGIGWKDSLPWPKNREDMGWFRERTINQIVVMGRKTWESLGSYAPLKGRLNVVVSSKPLSSFPGAVGTLYGDNLGTAIRSFEKGYDDREVLVMGGGEIYTQLFPVCDKIYLTRIPGTHEADTFIDTKEILNDFEFVAVKNMETCSAETWTRKPK